MDTFFKTEKEREEYWCDVVAHRMPLSDELHRLAVVLKGFLYESGENMTTVEWWNTKRPYDNKNIPASIIFILGWDFRRVLTREAAPAWVVKEAEKLHELVKDELRRDMEFLGV